MFVASQYKMCVILPFWHLEFWGGFWIFGKYVLPGAEAILLGRPVICG